MTRTHKPNLNRCLFQSKRSPGVSVQSNDPLVVDNCREEMWALNVTTALFSLEMSSGAFPIFCRFMVWRHSNHATEEMAEEWLSSPPHQGLLPSTAASENSRQHEHSTTHNYQSVVTSGSRRFVLTHGIWWCGLTSGWRRNHLLN